MTTPSAFAEPNATTSPVLELGPNPAFADEELRIEVARLQPHSRVSITAETEDDDQRLWKSKVEFTADAVGRVKISDQPPARGSYRRASAMGLFWSMKLAAPNSDASPTFAKTTSDSKKVRIAVRAADHVLAATELERKFVADGTTTRDLTIDGEIFSGVGDGPASGRVTVGRLCIPEGPGPHPVVIVLSGSGGGFDVDKAALLSRHGFATLALVYFGVAPLPLWLNRVPLEYFENAIEWLKAQPEIDRERIGVLGVSRGAELALLLGSGLSAIRAVVGYAPSSVAWAASGRDKSTGELIPCWTHHGQPVPFAPLPLRGFMMRSAFPVAALKKPVMFRNLFSAGLRNREAVSRASIPVERIRGPILLVSGGDDHLWPAAEMSAAIVERLKRKNFQHAVEHIDYPGAGHMLRYPFLPTTTRVSPNKHLRGAKFSFGGNAESDAAAQTDAWFRSIAFLQKHL